MCAFNQSFHAESPEELTARFKPGRFQLPRLALCMVCGSADPTGMEILNIWPRVGPGIRLHGIIVAAVDSHGHLALDTHSRLHQDEVDFNLTGQPVW